MKRALSEFKIEGIKTTIPFQQEIMNHPDFVNGEYGIEWVGDYISKTQS
jgi:acetyl-CoA carboxylase biotin carboxylase subunit